jgi:hypothetical protein
MAGEVRACQKGGATGGAWRPSCTEGGLVFAVEEKRVVKVRDEEPDELEELIDDSERGKAPRKPGPGAAVTACGRLLPFAIFSVPLPVIAACAALFVLTGGSDVVRR